jgi:hypothetical protein
MTAQAPGGKSVGPQGRTKKQDIQPGTARKGTTWQSHDPDPDDEDDKLESALEDSFPASDPPAPAAPTATGWEAVDKDKKAQNKK